MAAYVLLNPHGEAEGVIIVSDTSPSPTEADTVEQIRAQVAPHCSVSCTDTWDLVDSEAQLRDLYAEHLKPASAPGTKTVRVQLAQLVREVAEVEITVPEGASEDEILAAASERYAEDDGDLDWKPDTTWGTDEGTHDVIGGGS